MCAEFVRIEHESDIGLICLNKPPVNALGVALRTAVFDALQTLLTDKNVKAIVLYGEGRYFSAGADIKDLARAAEEPTLPVLLKALNDSEKTVIACLHGIAFGGAFELALAAHIRVGIAGLRVALPEVKLGLLPGAGGTQRLPRLSGMQAALDVICSGRELSDQQALDLGILNRLTDGTVREVGIKAALDYLNGTLKATTTDSLSVSPNAEALSAARERYANGLNGPLRAIDAIEASCLPIEKGLAIEREFFIELMRGDERAGLVHAFFAERATTKIPEQLAEHRDVSKVGIIGGGTMGVGIATAFLIAGIPVTLIELAKERVAQADEAIKTNLTGALKRGKLNAQSHRHAIESLRVDTCICALSAVDLVIEAIFEDMQAKIDLFRQLDKTCKAGAILATNTSYLDVNTIAAVTARPEDVIGLHFFSPAHIMRLLEVVVADKTSPDVVSTSFVLARKINKIPVRAGVCDGFIGNRILTRYRKCTEYLLLDGAEFEQIDNALEQFGFALGPFAVSDLAGLDIARARRLQKAASRPAEERYSRVSDLICDEGWLGRKTGKGYYLYDDSNVKHPNPAVVEIVNAERKALGISLRDFTDQQIVDRCITAIIMEAAQVLQEKIALRPVDIDAVKLFGYGFPRHRGGPMHIADQVGVDTIIERIQNYKNEDDYFWQVPRLLLDMQQNQQSFVDLNTV